MTVDIYREIEPGCEGLDPAGELRYGIEYRALFNGGVVRRYQLVLSTTDFCGHPVDDDDSKARRFLEDKADVAFPAQSQSAEELDRALATRGFRLVLDAPQHKYKLWQLIVRTPSGTLRRS